MTRFHLDEHVAHAVAEGLELRGFDVTTTVSAGLISAPDNAHIDFARKQGRVIFTNDADFLRIARTMNDHAGIVYAPAGARGIGEIINFLSLMRDCLEPTEMIGVIEYA